MTSDRQFHQVCRRRRLTEYKFCIFRPLRGLVLCLHELSCGKSRVEPTFTCNTATATEMCKEINYTYECGHGLSTGTITDPCATAMRTGRYCWGREREDRPWPHGDIGVCENCKMRRS